MEKTTSNTEISSPRSSALVFTLPGILPEQSQLLLDRETRTVMLLSTKDAKSAPALYSISLKPSSERALLALLQAYPGHCSHQTLFNALFPLPPYEKSERTWEQNLAIRPIRRAIAALAPALQAFGLQVISLRGRGYMLTSFRLLN